MRQFQMAFRIWKCLNFECNPIWICPWEFTWRLVQPPVTSDNTTRWRTRYYTKWRRLGLFILLIKSALKTSNDKAPSFLNTSTIYNSDVIMGAMVSHQRLDCILNRLFRCRSKKIPKLRVTGLCEGNSPVTGEFPAQRVSNAENVSIWWRHHVLRISC